MISSPPLLSPLLSLRLLLHRQIRILHFSPLPQHQIYFLTSSSTTSSTSSPRIGRESTAGRGGGGRGGSSRHLIDVVEASRFTRRDLIRSEGHRGNVYEHSSVNGREAERRRWGNKKKAASKWMNKEGEKRMEEEEKRERARENTRIWYP